MEQKLNNSGKARNLVFTWNNYEKYKYITLLKMLSEDKRTKYLVYGFEVGESGTPHIQGYVEFTNARSYKSINKEFFANAAYFENRRGTAKQASDYCKKDGKFEEFGELSEQGSRKDIEIVREMIKDGKSMKEICEEATSYQSIRTAEKLLSYNEEKRSVKPKVYWIWGPSGCGKSVMAHEICKGNDFWISGCNHKWWDGYDRHKYIILDDIRKDSYSFNTLIRIIDWQPFRVEVKGGSRELLAEVIVITSPFHPKRMCEMIDSNEDPFQVLRRIYDIIKISKDKSVEHYIRTEVGGNNETPT